MERHEAKTEEVRDRDWQRFKGRQRDMQ